MTIGALTMSLLATSYVLAANAATYSLANGETLIVRIDQDLPVTVTFATASFVSISAATANEVCGVLNQAFAADQVPANATVVGNAVQINSNDDGVITIVGGTAASVFAFAAGTTSSGQAGSQPSAPTFHDLVSIAGIASYTTGGVTGLAAALRTAAGQSGRAILGIAGAALVNISGTITAYAAYYNVATDKLQLFGAAGSTTGLTELGSGSSALASATISMDVISQ